MLHRELFEVELIQDGEDVRIKGTHEYVRLNLATVATGREVQLTFAEQDAGHNETSYLVRRAKTSTTEYMADGDWRIRQLSWDENDLHYILSGLRIAEPSLSADSSLDFLTPSNTILEHDSGVYMHHLGETLPMYVGKIAGIEMLPYIPPAQTAELRRPSLRPQHGQFAQIAA